MKFKIEKSVFEKFPDLVVAMPVIVGFENNRSAELALQLLREVEEKARAEMTVEQFWKDARVTAYLDCFKAFGVDPEKFMPAHVALTKRVLEGGKLPNINPMVNLYNAMSIKYLTPFGGENIDSLYGDFVLKFAKGGEQWIAIGAEKSKPAIKDELVWGDDFDLSTRALNWRQCDRTKMTGETKNGYFIMDGFGSVNKENIKKAAEEFVEVATKLFAGEAQMYWMDKESPEVELPFKSKKLSSVEKKIITPAEGHKNIQDGKSEKTKQQIFLRQKGSISYHLAQMIAKAINAAFEGQNVDAEHVFLEHPSAEEHGDYSTNVALQLAKQLADSSQGTAEKKLNPREVADRIITQLHKNISSEGSADSPSTLLGVNGQQIIERIEVAGPGFINFWLKKDVLVGQMQNPEVLSGAGGNSEADKKIVIEVVSPNINKPLHIGHLRNAALGMSVAELYKALGWQVVRDEINNDRGLHIMKAVLGYLVHGRKIKAANNWKDMGWRKLLEEWISDNGVWKIYRFPKGENQKGDEFVGNYYVLGEQFMKEYTVFAEEQLSAMLQAWEDEEPDIWKLWQAMSDWVHEGLDQTYVRIGVKHDKKWYEHDLYKEGRDYIFKAVDEGKFERLPDGAIQANLEPYGLANKILIRKDGTSIYVTFDIALTKHKVDEFAADRYVWVVGSDQVDHFKRLFAIFEILGLGKADNFYHLAYGMVRVPGGKMSSRMGNVILADDLIDKMVELAAGLMAERKIGQEYGEAEKKKIAEAVGIGALKYGMLKVNPLIDITFDLEKSVSLEGDSGPYLQYTYARARSVLRKSQDSSFSDSTQSVRKSGNQKTGESKESENSDISDTADKSDLLSSIRVPSELKNEELAILRWLYRFPEVVEQAARTYSPNLICTYLFELAKRFNNFYNSVPILGPSLRSSQAAGLNNGSISEASLQSSQAAGPNNVPILKSPEQEQKFTEPLSENLSNYSVSFRLALTEATAIVLKNGLNLLGIAALERM